MQDITARKELEATLDESIRELERSNLELRDFAYLVAHDFQEPLKTIRKFVMKIGEEVEQHSEVKPLISKIVRGADRLQDVINAQLAYAHAGASGVGQEQMPLALPLATALQDLGASIDRSAAKITIEELPEVEGDRALLSELFLNLLSNAIKFRRPNRQLHIHVSARRVGPDYEICIADNGIGLRSRYAESIFEPFRRLHAQDEFPGTGMGLAIAKKIVERHGGRIWALSDPDEGSKFFFTLPDPFLAYPNE